MNGSTPLNNQRHERFAQLIAQGKSATSAYVEAGYASASADSNAVRLMENQSITERTQYLKQQAARKAVVTAQMALEQLAIEMAGTGPDTTSGARTKAAELILKYHGAFTERTEQTGTVTIRVIRE
jgi:phage terminase small subunit